MEQQVADLTQELRRLGEQSQQQQQAIQRLIEERTQAQGERLREVEQIAALQQRLLDMQRASKPSFIDTKGIGKPAVFQSELKAYPAWSFKMGNFLEGIVTGIKEALEWAADQEEPISDLEEIEGALEGVNALETGKQLYTVMAQLCEGEAFYLVRNVTEPNGWEA